MKESTIRKFKKAWMEKNGVEVIDTQHNEQVLDLVASGEPSVVPYDFNGGMGDKMEESQSVPLPLTVSRGVSIDGVNLGPVKLKRRTSQSKFQSVLRNSDYQDLTLVFTFFSSLDLLSNSR